MGNLVAPPAGCGAGGCRHSASVLKLMQRHFARGPMGAHECLAIAAAAQQARSRAAAAAATAAALAEEARLRAAPASAHTPGAAAASPAALPSGGLARALGAAGKASQPPPSPEPSALPHEPPATPPPTPPRAPPAPCRPEASPFRTASVVAAAAAAGNAATSAAGVASGPALDNLALVQLLALPYGLEIPSYGLVLQHVGPPALPATSAAPQHAAPCEEYAGQHERTGHSVVPTALHVLFSHRRPGAVAGGAGELTSAATATGLAVPRAVVRCAVLPPLRALLRRPGGLAAALAAGRAPSREELGLEVVEEPLSQLDVAR